MAAHPAPDPIGTMDTRPPPPQDPQLGWHVRLVRRYVGPGPYLDYGCAEGTRLRRLREHGPASGFEPAADLAAVARQTAPGCPVLTDPAELADAAFRGIVAVDALTRHDDDAVAATLVLWRRVLRPGGRALVSVPDGAGRARRLRDDAGPAPRSHDQWRELLAAGGFGIVEEGSDGLCAAPYSWVPAALELRAVPAALQFMTGRLYLAAGTGESAVFVVEAPG